MAKPQGQRVENAVIAMFEHDHESQSLVDVVCDLVGIPPEEDSFSRTWIYDQFINCETGQEFLKACYKVIFEVADKD